MKKDDEDEPVSPAERQFILQTFPFIHKIIRRKLGAAHRDALEDLKQRVFLKLWRWRLAKSEGEEASSADLSGEEWRKMAHVVAHNEVLDFFKRKDNNHILFSQMNEAVREKVFATESADRLAGNSATEVRSILRAIWEAAQTLSLRQKYSYFLPYERFVIEFIAYGCCSIKELAAYFETTEKELSELTDALPLADGEIIKLLERKLGEKISAQKIWEARSKTKAKLAGRLQKFISDGRSSKQSRT